MVAYICGKSLFSPGTCTPNSWTDGQTCRKTVTVGRMDQRIYVQVETGYFRLRTDGQPKNIIPPVPKGGSIKIEFSFSIPIPEFSIPIPLSIPAISISIQIPESELEWSCNSNSRTELTPTQIPPTNMTHVVEILPHVRQGPVTVSIIMNANDLVTQGARTSAAMILT